MKKEEVPWSRRCVFICTKCHKSFPEGSFSQEGNCGENLKNYLKAEVKQHQLQDEIRVMNSSCLNVCEPQRQAVFVQEASGSGKIYVLHPENERSEILQIVQDISECL